MGFMKYHYFIQKIIFTACNLFFMLLVACENVDEIGLSSDQELQAKAAADGATYYDQTKAIIDQYCVTCHYPDSPLAPFSLASFQDVYAKQSAMIFALETDTMPTEGSPDLTSDEFNLLLGWLLNGAPSGREDAPPLANAGVDQQVDENVSATLNGSASRDDVGIASYSWTQTLGITVTLNNTALVNPQFTTPSVSATETLEFELTVTDTVGQTDTDRVLVIVNSLDLLPSANAGTNQAVNEGDTVNLDGSASSDDMGISTFSWVQQSGSTVTLTEANTALPSFNAPAITSDEVLVFQLTVTDTVGQTSTDTVQVTVVDDTSPTANAGTNQSVVEASSVNLDGSGSMDNEGAVTYLWTQTFGTNVSLSSSTVVNPGFTAPDVSTGSDTLIFQLVVSDSLGQNDIDTVQVTVSDVAVTDLPPTANAGSDQVVNEGGAVSLDGSASSDDKGILTYAWIQTAGISVSLANGTSQTPSFTAPTVTGLEVLAFELTVTDTIGQTNMDLVQITVNNDQAPLANAGTNQTVKEGDWVLLDGSGSSDDFGITSYSWQQILGTEVTLSDSSVVNPGFTAPDVLNNATLIFQLTVTDTTGQESTGDVQVSVLNDEPPFADAGSDQFGDENTLVNLDGSGSTDDVGITSYAWLQVSGTNVTLSNATAVNPSFTTPAVVNTEVLIFQLTVSDTGTPVQTSNDTVQVTVNATTSYTYNSDTKTILDNKCVSCHRPGGLRSVSPLTNYSEVMVYINDIFTRVELGSMPKPPITLTSAEQAILLDWIGGGAPEL